MIINRYIKILLVSTVFPFLTVLPTTSLAETIQVLRGDMQNAIQVPLDRGVVVESSTPFLEVATANPSIVDIEVLSDRQIKLTGKSLAVTTLTLIHGNGKFNNVTLSVVQSDFSIEMVVNLPEMGTSQEITADNGKASDIVEVASSRAVVLQSNTPFDNFFVADKKVANISALSDRTIYVLGVGEGKTTISFLRDSGEPSTDIEVQVGPNN